MDLNKYFDDNFQLLAGLGKLVKTRPQIICADGLSMSVQASKYHYCTPRDDFGPYSKVEVGFPSERIEEFMPFAEDSDRPTDTVYALVPIEIVEQVIEAHGGAKEEANREADNRTEDSESA